MIITIKATTIFSLTLPIPSKLKYKKNYAAFPLNIALAKKRYPTLFKGISII
jgi:hypothetical protein